MIASLLFLASAAPLLGDFDHDGRPDRAYIRQAGSLHQLVIERASGEITALVRVDDPDSFYFEKLPAGTYKTACAKGQGKQSTCKQSSISLTGDTLQFGTSETSQAAAIWKDGHFQVRVLGD